MKYDALFKISFESDDWEQAQKDNAELLRLLEYICNVLEYDVSCKILREAEE